MVRITPTVALAFQQELEKTAAPMAALRSVGSFLSRQAGAAGAGMGVGSLVGAGAGAGIEGVRGYRQAKQEGATGGQAATSALLHGLGGVGKGAVIGAGVGGAAGLASGRTGTELAKKLVAGGGNPVSGAARFGERQVHALTGALPSGYASRGEAMNAMQAGAFPARERMAAATAGLGKAWEGEGNLAKAVKEHVGAKKYLEVANKAEGMGLTSLPGYVKSLATPGQFGETLRTGFGEQWHQGGGVHKALNFGLPAVMAAGELARSKDPEGRERGRLARTGSAIGGLAFNAGPIPIVGGLLAASAGGKVGGLVGSAGDKILARKKPTGQGQQLPILTPDGEGNPGPPVERNYSNAALGRPPEGLGV